MEELNLKSRVIKTEEINWRELKFIQQPNFKDISKEDGEDWKDVIDYNGIYLVSNFGRVKSCERCITNASTYSGFQKIRERILKFHRKDNGYLNISLCSNCVKRDLYVHRLVALAFIPNPENLPEVNHIDGNKENNCVENLEWVTKSENSQHAYKTGLKKPSLVWAGKTGIEHNRSKRIIQFDLNGIFVKEFAGIAEATRKTNVDSSDIVKVAKGKSKKAGGFVWKYAV